MSRLRRSLTMLSTALITAGLLTAAGPASAAESADYAAATQRWKAVMTGGTDYDPADPALAAAIARVDETAAEHSDSFIRDADRTTLWPDLTATDEVASNSMLTRLQDMATAYATHGSAHEGETAYRDDVIDGLDWIYRHRFNEELAETGNWWHWEIGMPQATVAILGLLADEVPAELAASLVGTVEHFVPDPTYRTKQPELAETGANRVDKVLITVGRGLLTEDESVLTMGRDALSQVFDYVTSGDGFYLDGSFIQHDNFAYTGSYGNVLIIGLSKVFAILATSPWDVTDPDRANVFAWLKESYAPVVYRGQYLAHVRGRSISRSAADDHDLARGLITAMAQLHPAAAAEDKAWIGDTIAGWIAANDYKPFEALSGVPSIIAVRTATTSADNSGDPTFHKQFPGMDRMVHGRDGYSFSVSARSERIAAYESGNGENLYGFYTGEGMTYLYNDDLSQYSDGFWPTVDPYRLAGTTVATQESYPRSAQDSGFAPHLGPNAWVGGSNAGDELGAYGMAFTAQTDPGTQAPIDLIGKKSWFTVGDAIVAVGSDISAGEVAAQTTVENRRLPDGGGRLTIDGETVDSNGWDADLSGRSWLSIAGAGGYVFTGDSAGLRGLGEARTGKWSQIGADPAGAPGDEVTRDYATVWFDHGPAPTAASYEYTVLPNASADATAAYAADPAVVVVDNTADVHAVEDRFGSVAANFWNCGVAAGAIAADGPASVTMEHADGQLELAISDPKQSDAPIRIELARTTTQVVSADPNVSVDNTGDTTVIEVDTAGKAGTASLVSLQVSDVRPTLPDAGCAN